MTSTRKIPVAMLLATGLLSSCGTQSPPNAVDAGSGASSAEQAEVAHQVASRPDLVDDAVFEASVEAEVEVSAAEPGRPAPPDSLRRPRLRWWRTITGVRRSFEFAYRDTDSTGRPRLATVTVRKTLTGSFNVARPPLDRASRPVVVRKPLVDHWVRRLVLHRVEVPGFDRPQWRVVGTSGVEVTARGAVTEIVSVRIEAAAFDTTVVDPLALFRLRQVLRFDAEDSVRVTVTTRSDDDVVVLQRRDHRVPFRNLGGGSYQASFRVGAHGGVHHAGINAVARTAIVDDRAPYDSQAWILPYVVRPTELADLGD